MGDGKVVVRLPVVTRAFPPPSSSRTGCAILPAFNSVRTGSSAPGVKWPRREVDQTYESSAEVKEYVELYLHLPIFMAWCLVKYMKKIDFCL
jgi:hypothetical protein